LTINQLISIKTVEDFFYFLILICFSFYRMLTVNLKKKLSYRRQSARQLCMLF